MRTPYGEISNMLTMENILEMSNDACESSHSILMAVNNADYPVYDDDDDEYEFEGDDDEYDD